MKSLPPSNTGRPPIQPALLKVAREAAGLSQQAVIEELGYAQVTVSRWENGFRTPDEPEVVQLARLYSVTPAFFRATAREAGLMAGDLHYRRRSRVKVSDLRRLEAVTNWLRIGADRLLDEVSMQPTLDIPELASEQHTPAEAARHVRRYWNLPIGPIDDLTHLLELAGIVVIMDDFPAEGIDGVSMWAGPWPVMYLSRRAPIDRRRFTLAHELGHMVMHRDYYEEDTGEAEANEFASEFLMPADQIRPRLRRLSLREALNLKLEWRVSVAALIQRARDVKAITPEDATRLHKQRSYRRWTRHEPMSDQLREERPTTLMRVLDTLTTAGYSTQELEELLYVPNLIDHPAWWDDSKQTGLRLVR